MTRPVEEFLQQEPRTYRLAHGLRRQIRFVFCPEAPEKLVDVMDHPDGLFAIVHVSISLEVARAQAADTHLPKPAVHFLSRDLHGGSCGQRPAPSFGAREHNRGTTDATFHLGNVKLSIDAPDTDDRFCFGNVID